MIIGICALENNENSPVSDRFARANFFVIYDHENLTFKVITNPAIDESSGAGTKAIKALSKEGVDIILGPEVGPKALEALSAFEMEAYNYTGATDIKDALYLYFENKLPRTLTSHGKKHK